MKIKKKSQLQEKRVAKEISGRPVVASGALWSRKGDVRNNDFLIECKYTDTPFYSLTFNTWDKINREAIKDGLRIPVMSIEIQSTTLAVLHSLDWGEPPSNNFNCIKAKSSIRITPRLLNTHIKFDKSNILVIISWEDFLESMSRICDKQEDV